MAAKNSMPERAVAQTEIAVLENHQEIREQVRKKNPPFASWGHCLVKGGYC
ncbi:hypothetical protein GJV04_08530 [Enterobacteriaceae bacterium RIT714]|nr:hypothetical protein [Enterobacteriaceae bacterium RIT714]